MNQKTISTQLKHIQRRWYLVDLKDQILGRAASQIAILLQGKNKPYYAPYLDCGDYVVAINAGKVKLSGRKPSQKIYFRHSGYPGGAHTTPLAKLIKTNPRQIIELAVTGMLPKNKLRHPRLRRLKVFTTASHSYEDKFNSESRVKNQE